MPIQHLFLHLPTFPHRAPDFAIAFALDLAGRLGARVSAAVAALARPRPGPVLARHLDLTEVIETQERASMLNARHLCAALAERASARAVACEIETLHAAPDEIGGILVARLRTSDLGIVPFEPGVRGQAELLETLLFDGGRPVLALPREPARPGTIDEIVVAWDHGRAATRALADAMPLLRAARRVRVVTVDEPPKLPVATATALLSRHLAAHGIAAVHEVIEGEGDGQAIGGRLMRHALARGADLLVMGAHGHSRLREFLLGSATRDVLAAPLLPVLLSH